MKIDELKVNSYGKLKNKDIKFEDGINIIYGENERGKSTLLNFIVNMFYGTSKNKKGKIMSDFDKYKPWDTEEFSGKMKYTLDNGKKYEIFREFGKKNPKIYDENMEDVSKEYSIDKNTGSQFFYEQTKVDEQAFTSTVVSYQNEVELDNQTQNILLQKIANTSSTGADNISYKKAFDKLNKKQLDEIGTTRSQGKPINIAIREIENLTSINESLRRYENYKYEIEDKKYALQNDIFKMNNQYEFANKINFIKQQQKVEEEKLKYGENKIDDIESKIQKLIDEKENVESNKMTKRNADIKKFNLTPYIIALVLGILLSVVSFAVIKNIIISIACILIGVIICVIGIGKKNKIKAQNSANEKANNEVIQNNRDIEKKIYEINAQIELLEKSQKEQVNEVEKIKNELLKNINNEKEKLKNDYFEKIDITEINRLLNSTNLSYEIEKIQSNLNEKNIELHRLELDKENILPKLEELAENEEKLTYNKEIYEELKEKNNAINLAKQALETAYQKMKNDVTPKFTQKLSENINNITNGKYNKVIINEEDGIIIELPNGEYKNANTLSVGTIQQLYMAFRLSMAEDISDEEMPIILDEIFAFSDDSRMEDSIKNLYNNYANSHQILLFTCTNREEQILQKLNFEYNKITL